MAILHAEQGAMPATGYHLAIRGEIVIEASRKGQASVRTAVYEAADDLVASHDKTMKAARAHLQHEIASGAIGEGVEQAKAYPCRRC